MSDPLALGARQLTALFAKRALSPVELLDAVLARIEREEPRVNAFVLLDREGAHKAAKESEERWTKRAPLSAADGLVATIKDNILLAGFPARRGSKTGSNAAVTEDAPASARLKEAGCVIVGKTTLPEFGWKGLCDSPLTGITHNPWRLDRSTGGSSGGAAAAAALGLGQLHLGTDAAGSIRIPSAFCGVFGIKPSFGRVPAYPASPFSALAHVGPMARSVEDAALMLSIIGRPDARDFMAWNTPCPDYTIGLDAGVAGMRIAYSSKLNLDIDVEPKIAAACETAAQVFLELGASVERVDPTLPDCRPIIDDLWKAVAAFIMSGISEEQRQQCDPGLARDAATGSNIPTHRYIAASAERANVALAMMRFHEDFDLLLTPQMPVPAILAGYDVPPNSGMAHWIDWSPFTYPFNITQQPAASVPCGLTDEGLPIGLQIVGPHREDGLVLAAARAFESARPFARIDAARD
ncbi:MAG: aspartyl-tRNA(Asn)/glutamyl-tRNA(Gln) amidotransferase subunit [Methylobacteriaceae bacterium]|jgi:aspartyl-tRNA(Asn)/glutamyl-tRNA(Gln) amidotransferase subunit A|nr:aspartyl-tRNA(Asn)/glutamyl-tRNA(Gln) amidotransferase subunit [Methylobacteriaceae bacterium]